MFSNPLYSYCLATFVAGVASGYLYREYVFRRDEDRDRRIQEWVDQNQDELKEKWENSGPPHFLSEEDQRKYEESLWWWQKLW